MKIEVIAIEKLRPTPSNARKHGEANLKAIEESLRIFGQQKPIVALKDGTVIAGNGTLEAAKRLGWKGLAVKRFENEKLAWAFAIVDNRTAELSEWDEPILDSTLKELEADYSLKELGFDDYECNSDTPDPEPIELRPFKSIHVLVSFDVTDADKAQELLELVASKYPSAEVSGSATDNSHYFEKVRLREAFIKTGREKVLEILRPSGKQFYIKEDLRKFAKVPLTCDESTADLLALVDDGPISQAGRTPEKIKEENLSLF